MSAAVDSFAADTVAVLSCPEMNGARLRELGWALEETSTDLCVASALLDVAGPRTTIRPIAGLPLLHVDQAELGGVKRLIKGALDRLVAGLALLMLAPAFVVIALAIRADDHGPVFFRQKRVGKDGQTFSLWKFRTMVVDAEERRTKLAAFNEAAGVLFKMRRDPRVTKVGVWLRRWSLDELPQLINVFIGEMSLVGPRQALPQETARYGDDMQRRLKVHRASLACGRSVAGPTCRGKRRSGWIFVTWRTGQSRLTCRSSGRPVLRSCADRAPTSVAGTRWAAGY